MASAAIAGAPPFTAVADSAEDKAFVLEALENTLLAGDVDAVLGEMNGITTKSGKETGPFTFALRARARVGQVVLWHWFEDGCAVSRACRGRPMPRQTREAFAQ